VAIAPKHAQILPGIGGVAVFDRKPAMFLVQEITKAAIDH